MYCTTLTLILIECHAKKDTYTSVIIHVMECTRAWKVVVRVHCYCCLMFKSIVLDVSLTAFSFCGIGNSTISEGSCNKGMLVAIDV